MGIHWSGPAGGNHDTWGSARGSQQPRQLYRPRVHQPTCQASKDTDFSELEGSSPNRRGEIQLRSGEGLEEAAGGWAQGRTRCKDLPAVAMDVAGAIPPVHRRLIPAWTPALTLPGGEGRDICWHTDTPLPQAPKGGHLLVGQPAGTPEVAWASMTDAGCPQGTCWYTSESSMIQGEDIANKRLHNLSIPSTVLPHLNTSTVPNLSIFPLKNAFPSSPRQGASCPGDISPAVPLTEESFGRRCMTGVALALDFLLVFIAVLVGLHWVKKLVHPHCPWPNLFSVLQSICFLGPVLTPPCGSVLGYLCTSNCSGRT